MTKTAIQYGIQNPNTSGQGYHPDHLKTPFSKTLSESGMIYSHSTVVCGGGEYRLHHTWIFSESDQWRVGVGQSGYDLSYHWSASKSGSSYPGKSGSTNKDLAQYLKNKKRKLKKETIL